ncbi:MAG: hypothetical protein OXN18_10220 [Gemmatimonadota bacterium]|nr:hypothetical protein [Gemmatimonadota bacterium]
MANLRSFLWMAILVAGTPAHGVGQVLEGQAGPVEFIGLERWDAQELLEAIRRLAPDKPLAACAVTMKSELGFADAAVFGHFDADSPELIMSGDAELYTVIVGVEDSVRVRFRTAGSETINLPAPWEALKSVTEEDFGTLALATEMFHSRHDREGIRKRLEPYGIDATAFDPTWAMIEVLDGDEDHLLAREVLSRDLSWSSRATAASVLANFSGHDTAWHDLMATLTDPDGRVQSAAEAVLRGFVQADRARPIRWEPAEEPLAALLDGTNLFASPTVMKVLATTQIEQEFGRRLLKEAPDLLLAYVGAKHEETREPAVDLLKIVSGEDFGADPHAWSEWLNAPPDDS